MRIEPAIDQPAGALAALPGQTSSWSFANRCARGLWGMVWLILFRLSPRPCFGWRRWLLRCFGAKVHQTALVYPSTRIWAPWNLEMGEQTAMAEQVDCYNVAKVTLEPGAVVSQYSYLCTASHDITDPSNRLMSRPICLGPRAWVAARCFVGMGVRLGEGAVVAAGAVVVKPVEAWEVVGGNPARFLKKRELRSRVRLQDQGPAQGKS